jgi:hypothetical protein
MSRVAAVGGFLALILVLAGCGDPKHPAALEGTWRLTELRAAGTNARSPEEAQFQARMKKGLAENPSEMHFMPEGQLETRVGARGTWEVNGRQLKLEIGGAASPGVQRQQFTYRLESGGTTLRISRNGSEMVWTKQPGK